MSGRTAWNKGKKLSPEMREKWSEVQRGEKGYWYGKTLTPEHRAKISRAKSGNNSHFYGKKHTPETREKMSKSQRERWKRRRENPNQLKLWDE